METSLLISACYSSLRELRETLETINRKKVFMLTTTLEVPCKAQEARIYSPQVFHYIVRNNDLVEAVNTKDSLLREIMEAVLYPFNR
jgi:hypothetical protein